MTVELVHRPRRRRGVSRFPDRVSPLAILLAGAAWTPMAALAQSTNNWIGTTPVYGTTTNWQNGTTPLASETAVFSTLGTARSLGGRHRHVDRRLAVLRRCAGLTLSRSRTCTSS